MSEKHFAVLDAKHRPEIPAAEYAVGDAVTAKVGSYRITGRPHRQWYGANFAAVNVYWPAEEVELDAIPAALKNTERG